MCSWQINDYEIYDDDDDDDDDDDYLYYKTGHVCGLWGSM